MAPNGARMLDLSQPCTQEQFAGVVGISQQAVSELLTRAILTREASAADWLHAYCANLREQAAGRATKGDLDLATERARLASEQADRVAMENAKARREIAPIALLEAVLARTSRQIAGILEAIPVQIKRQAPELPPEVRDLIAAEINKARSLAANVELNLEDHDDGPVGDPESDPLRAAAA